MTENFKCLDECATMTRNCACMEAHHQDCVYFIIAAPACPHCRREMARICTGLEKQLYEALKDLYGISSRECFDSECHVCKENDKIRTATTEAIVAYERTLGI